MTDEISERPFASPSPSLSVHVYFLLWGCWCSIWVGGWAGGRDKDFEVGLENWQPMLRSDFTALSLHVLWKVLFQPSPACECQSLVDCSCYSRRLSDSWTFWHTKERSGKSWAWPWWDTSTAQVLLRWEQNTRRTSHSGCRTGGKRV